MSTPLDRHAEPYAINFSASPLEDLHGVGSEAGVAYKDAKRTKLKVSLNSMTAPKLSDSMQSFRLRR